MKRTLVYCTSFTRSIDGCELLIFSVIHSRQGCCGVKLAMRGHCVSPAEVSGIYGKSVDWSRVSVVGLEPHGWLAKFDRHLRFVAKRWLRRMGNHFAVCIICANPVDLETQSLGSFRTVVTQAMQSSLYGQPKEIYLAGIDCSVAGHFDADKISCDEKDDYAFGVKFLAYNVAVDGEKLKNFAGFYCPDVETSSVNPFGLKGILKELVPR